MENVTNIINQKDNKIEFCLDNHYSLIYLDDLILEKLGYSFPELKKKNIGYNELIDPNYKADYQDAVKSELCGKIGYNLIDKDGQAVPITEIYKTYTNLSGEKVHLGTVKIIGDKKIADNNKSNYKYMTFEYRPDTYELTLFDTEQKIMSSIKTQINNFPFSSIKNERIHSEDIEDFYVALSDCKKGNNKFFAELRILNSVEDKYKWYRCIGEKNFDKQGMIIKGFAFDIDEEKNKIAKNLDLDSMDIITGLLNKSTAKKRISKYLEKNKDLSAFMVINIDNFRYINENISYSYGDAILSEMGKELKNFFHQNDIICRIECDEYLVFCPNMKTVQNAEIKAEAFRKSICEKMNVSKGKQYNISVSIGVSIFPKDGNTFEKLYSKAGSAMMLSKNQGKNKLNLYASEIDRVWDIVNEETSRGINLNITVPTDIKEHMLSYIEKVIKSTSNFNIAAKEVLGIICNAFDFSSATYIDINNKNNFHYDTEIKYNWQSPNLECTYELKTEDFCCEFFEGQSFLESEYAEYNVGRDIIPLNLLNAFIKRKTAYTLVVGFVYKSVIKSAIVYESTNEMQMNDDTIKKLLFISRAIMSQGNYDRLYKYHLYQKLLRTKFEGHTCLFGFGIDKESYKINYIDSRKTANELGIKLGDLCYKTIRGNDRPCSDCPIRNINDNNPVGTSDIYLNKTGRWIHANASNAKIEGIEPSVAVSILNYGEFCNDSEKNEIKSKVRNVYHDFIASIYILRDNEKAVNYVSDNITVTDENLKIICENKTGFSKFVVKSYSDLNENIVIKCKTIFVNVLSNVKAIVYATFELRNNGKLCETIKECVNYDIKEKMPLITSIKHSSYSNGNVISSYDENFESMCEIQAKEVIANKPRFVLGLYMTANAHIYYMNSYLKNLLFDENTDYFSRSFLDVVSKNDSFRLISFLEKPESFNNHIQLKLKTKNNTALYVNYTAHKYNSCSGEPVLMGICEDITEIISIKNQLEIYENSSRGGLFVSSTDENIQLIYANEIFYEMIGYKKDEFLNMFNNSFSQIIDYDDLAKIKAIIKNANTTGREIIDFSAKVQCGDGREKTLYISAALKHQNDRKVICGLVVDISKQENLSRQIQESEERYRLALRQTKISVWEYDIEKQMIKATQSSMEAHGFNYDLENVPQVLILSGHIHPDSISECRKLYEKVNSGQQRVVAEICKRNNDDTGWWWEKITYTSVFNKEGKPIRTVGLGEDITREKENEIKYKEDIHAKNMLLKDTLCNFRLNLNDNSICFFSAQNDFEILMKEKSNYDDFVNFMEEAMVNDEDKKKFTIEFTVKNLKKQFMHSQDHINMEFRKEDSNGILRWYMITVHLMKDAIKRDVYAYINVRDIHQQKVLEQNLISRVEKDSITGVYNRVTFDDIAEKALEQKYNNKQTAAVMVIKPDIYRIIAKESGYMQADIILKSFADAISLELGSSCIFGRLFAEEFIAFVKDDLSKIEVEHLVKNLVKSINKTFENSYNKSLSVSVGYCFSTSKNENIEKLYSQAKTAADVAAAKGENNCVEFIENIDKSLSPVLESVPVKINSEYKDLIIKCGFEIEGKINSEEIMKLVIGYIETFYETNDIAIVEIDYNSKNINNIYSKNSDVDTYNMIFYNDMVLNYIISKGYIVIKDTEDFKYHYQDTKETLRTNDISSVIISVSSKSDVPVCCIFIKNPKKNVECREFIDGVGKILSSKLYENQISTCNNYYRFHDDLTALLNRSSYKRYKSSLKEETLISMGIVLIDINKLSKINKNYGQDYGDKLLVQTADLIKSIFTNAKIFRVFGGYFQVICENISQEVFSNQINKLRIKSKKQLKDILAIGYSWTDTDIKIDDLLYSSEEKMMIAKENFALTQKYDEEINEENITNLKNLIAEGRFITYLQPKQNLETDTVEAAEALIRYENEDGTIIYPDRFIPTIEKKGMLKYIDLFVFESVCKLIKKWTDNGIEPITVSLNFSRKTILGENLIEEMEGIYEKYNVPRKYLEIEVTESMADVEKETLVRISNLIHDRGYRISIDDFGSKYSNLSILSMIKLDAIKIDKSLINNLFSNKKTRLVVNSFIDVCKKMNVECIAEGVETIEQLIILKDMHCDFIQGYYTNKPIPIAEFEKLYIDGKR